MISASFRPLNFALLRGGFTSVDEFYERVNEDTILHSFYGDCADREASMRPLAEDVMVFSTFRRNNQIKWAQKPMLVHKGEYVMTFCGKTVLARCGNLVSMAAMQPSEDVPPAVLETPTDVVVPPLSYAAAPTAAAIAPAAIAPAAVTPIASSHNKLFPFVPPFYVPPGGSHSGLPPSIVTPPAPPITPPTVAPPPSTPPPATPPPTTPPPTTPPPTTPPPTTPPPTTPPPTPPTPPPPTHMSGDEFSGHQALFTLLFGLLTIGLIKLFTR
jgi:hypothetical protein